MNRWIQTEVVLGYHSIKSYAYYFYNTSNEPVEADEDRGDVARL